LCPIEEEDTCGLSVSLRRRILVRGGWGMEEAEERETIANGRHDKKCEEERERARARERERDRRRERDGK